MASEQLDSLYFQSHGNISNSTSQVQDNGTPRPTPKLFSLPEPSFSTKKGQGSNYTPRHCVPPKQQVKSAPPISRIFPRRVFKKAQRVSFKTHDTTLRHPYYNADRKGSFFDQCFDNCGTIGYGSFGEVSKARDREDGECYAVKRSLEAFRSRADRKRKLEEVEKHERIPRHPNCVRFVRAWEEKEHLFIQTELCKSSLLEICEEKHSIPESLIWNYLVDLLMAVKHLHRHNLAHLDIKPDNIFVTEQGVCKLGDFGLVLDLSQYDSDSDEAQEGDAKYMAPELLVGNFTKSADIFSLGMTILEAVSDLDPPTGGDVWQELRNNNIPESLFRGRRVSDDLKRLIRWMLHPDPARRPTIEELLHTHIVRRHLEQRKRKNRQTDVCRSLAHALDALRRTTAAGLRHLIALLVWFLAVLGGRVDKSSTAAAATPGQECETVAPEETSAPFSPQPLEASESSFSDDEMIVVGNSSSDSLPMAAPLDTSASGADSSFDADGFAMPRAVVARRAVTTPGQRSRRLPPLRPRTPSSPDSPIDLLRRHRETMMSPVSSITSSGARQRSLRFDDFDSSPTSARLSPRVAAAAASSSPRSTMTSVSGLRFGGASSCSPTSARVATSSPRAATRSASAMWSPLATASSPPHAATASPSAASSPRRGATAGDDSDRSWMTVDSSPSGSIADSDESWMREDDASAAAAMPAPASDIQPKNLLGAFDNVSGDED